MSCLLLRVQLLSPARKVTKQTGRPAAKLACAIWPGQSYTEL